MFTPPVSDLPFFFLVYLFQPSHPQAVQFPFNPHQVLALCDIAEQVLSKEPTLLESTYPLTPVSAPVKVFGNINGQFADLMSFFARFGEPFVNGSPKDINQFTYLFLGGYVDRGRQSLETICLLLAMKALYPNRVFLLRGNHETEEINSVFGFMEECEMKLHEDCNDRYSVYRRINDVFSWLPLAATVQGKLLCLHGGIGPEPFSLNEISRIRRPLKITDSTSTNLSQLVIDILWASPGEDCLVRGAADAGVIRRYNEENVRNFLGRNSIQSIIRSHDCAFEGSEDFAGGLVKTVWTAVNFTGKYQNKGALLIVDSDLTITAKVIGPP